MGKVSIKDALNFAVKKHNQGKLNEAEIIYRKILDKFPNNSNALHLLGLIAHQTGKGEEAVKYINKAIQINPNASYYSNLGMVYDSLGKEEESIKSFNKALSLNPNYNKAHLAHYNLGIYFKGRGEFEKALEHYNKAIKLKKDFFDAYWNRGLILLLLQRFEEGWKDYEFRFKKESPTDKRNFKKPKWDGSFLDGKKILIVSEQGLGDNIQFIRYIPLVKEKQGYIIFECRKELKKLFEGFSGIDEFIDKGSNLLDIDYDFYIHLMSLPKLFNTNLQNIPNKIPYLKSDFKLVEKFKSKINSDNFKIGIVWSGNPAFPDNEEKSVDLKKFESVKEFLKNMKNIKEVDFFSLQKGKPFEQLKNSGSEIIDMDSEITDFADTAAIIKNMDLIICVDTAVAHLAGALGKPVWVLLSYIPDWRWFVNRKDSPWYQTMKLFRQKKQGDWNNVFEEIKNELKKILI